MPFDYTSAQKLINFGKGFAGKLVGQPFTVYRLNSATMGDVVQDSNVVAKLNAKVTHRRVVTSMENEYLHVNAFEFLLSSDQVAIGDILVQSDPVYGKDQDTSYAIASRRPLKPVVAIRVESLCQFYRPGKTAVDPSAYRGPVAATELPFTIVNGAFVIGIASDTAAVVPCGIQSIGQIKNLKPTHLPLDNITSWWYVYIPHLPGLDRLRENDLIVYSPSASEEPVRLRVNTPYASEAGTAGHFFLCERVVV